MDSPHGIPEASSPVVMLPPTAQFLHSISRPEVSTNTATRAAARPPAINQHQQSRTRSFAAASAPGVRTNSPFSVLRPHGNRSQSNETVAAGPTTRSRKRSHAETTPVPPPSRKRRAPSSTQRERRSKDLKNASKQKKPPPGSDLKKAPPGADSACCKCDGNDDDADKKPAAVVNCCICMCDVEPKELAMINGCDHQFCFGCIEKWSERENKCPLCKARFTKIDRIHKKRKKGTKNTKKVKQKDQRSDLASGAALEGLLASLNRNSGSLARIIFGSSFEVGGFISPGRSTRAAISTTRSASGVRAEFAEFSEDDPDEDDSPMAAFMRALHGSSVANGIHMSTTVVQPMTVTARFSTTTRSFARNVHDSTAGNGADNPLEIDDDSVEEVIEID